MLCGLIVLLGVIVVYKLLDYVIRIPRIGNYSDRYIFVTGCDSGFGHELAKRLDSLGCLVFAGCFTEKGETELKKICSARLQPVPLDVSEHDSVRKAYELVSKELRSSGKGLWGVLNNAGALVSFGKPEWLTADDYRHQCEVNLFGLIDVTMTFLPLIKKTQGRIVNTSSHFGIVSMPISPTYSVSKYGVEAFTDALRRSLGSSGGTCKAVLIEPGGFKTAITNMDFCRLVFDRSWNKCSLEMKEEYASQYAKLKRMLFDDKKTNFESLPTDLSPVVNAYEHALLAKYPRPRYIMGRGVTAIPIQLLAAMPEFITDWVLKF